MNKQGELDFIQAEINKDDGIKRSELNAECKEKNWSFIAMSMLELFLKFNIGKFMTEDVRHYASKMGMEEPPNSKAWGGVITRAHRNGTIKFMGYGKTSNPRAHRTPACIWAKA